ncbi:OLC1v1029804C4 [Oldenlandia corymbosa var. corymbosa]|uniref:OLC1v1029804C4 n=1 Tax=Oldenlandia corymbosa var. corymbosa TaxID=529605 RepID=A0AAV1CHN5_OLDCO|nr:OLC1v1029804C4 [Oldenlandia corymbosa var. corymbosa]
MDCSMNLLKMCSLLLCLLIPCSSSEQIDDIYRVDSVTIYDSLPPYEWHYLKVELPQFVTFASLEVEAADFGKKMIKIGHSDSNSPVLCLRKGGFPLPDISSFASEVPKVGNVHNASKIEKNLWSAGQCYFIRDKVSIEFISEQISADVSFVGLFNGIGPIRTQAKMINTGPIFDISTTIYVKDCKNQSKRGQLCSKSIEELSCHNSSLCELGQSDESSKNYTGVSVRCLTCKKIFKESDLQDLASKTYFLDMPHPVEELMISGIDLKSSEAHHTEKIGNSLMCYARYGAVPGDVYDYAVDLTKMPLKISLPKIGTWYFNMQLIDELNVQLRRLQNSSELRYSVEWDVVECPDGNAGPNCSWLRYMLQVSQRDSSDGFLVSSPKNLNVSVELHNLHLEPMLSNTSYGIGTESDFAWTYFDIDVPRDAIGKNIHIELIANVSINYQLFIRFNGLPSESNWDYFYLSQSSHSDNGSSMFKLYKRSERRVDAYLLYPNEGLWTLGLMHPVQSNPNLRTELSLSVENCPNQCSNHGSCEFNGDQGPTGFRYYFCKCDGRFGGFDCSVQLVSLSGQRWHVAFLTASNAAALLPAIFALRQKAYAEWIVFICGGVSSALYHSCDTGSWCSLSFHVLQFMDFWLSFVAVLTTFLYLAFVSEVVRRPIHTLSFIVTALLSLNGVTNYKNIPLVVALGAFVMLCAWSLEVFGSCRSSSLSLPISIANTQHRLVKVKSWFPDLLKALNKRFKWRFVFAGLVTLGMAALSRNLETPESYWIWHR